MESSQKKLIISKILPFMDKAYFENFLKNEKLAISDIEVIRGENFLPKYAIILFGSPTGKQTFTSKNDGKNYPGFNYQITIATKTEEEEVASISDSKPNEKIIKFPIEYDKMIDKWYEITVKEPGLIFLDKDMIEKQNKVITYLIKKMGSNLIKGKSIMNVSLPVNIFDKRTLLQVFAYELSFAPIYLSRAYYSTDTLEKLKWVTVFLFSQLHLSPLQTKPFNPIMGETFQCKIGNVNFYAEQTLNKPPTTNFYAFDDDKLYKIYGDISTDASTGANSVKATKNGKFIVELKDGNVYEILLPRIHIKGLTVGKRLFNFSREAAVINHKANIACHLVFNPNAKGAIMSIFSSKQKTLPSSVKGNIVAATDLKTDSKGRFSKKKDSKSLGVVDGEWTNFLYFDNVLYWRVKTDPLTPLAKMDYFLPSDSILREDLNYFLEGKETESQAVKEKYEDIQRNDRKLREQYEKDISKKKK